MRIISAQFRLNMPFKNGSILDIGGFLQSASVGSEPGVTVNTKSIPPSLGGYLFPVYDCRLALCYLFFGLLVGLAISESIFYFPGQLVTFDISGFPAPVFSLENVFPFCHFRFLLV